MPVHKRDRNFQNIVRDLSISSVPADYIQTLSLVCINGDKITFQGNDINDNGDIISVIVNMVEENGNDDEIADIEIIIDYKKLERDIADLTDALLQAKNISGKDQDDIDNTKI
jgi:hypothetical protein